MKYQGLFSCSAIAIALSYSMPVLAQDVAPQAAAAETPGQTIIVTGTRRTDRTVAESPTPIDVYSGEELQKQGVADMMPQGVVDVFEMIEIEQKDREWLAALLQTRPCLFDSLLEQSPVGETRQQIMVRHEGNLLVGALAIGYVFDNAEQISWLVVLIEYRQSF